MQASLDSQPLSIIQRVNLPKRENAEKSLGNQYLPGYWAEGAAYRINNGHAQEIRQAGREVSGLYRKAMDYVIENAGIFDLFIFTEDKNLNDKIRSLISRSWHEEKDKGYVLDRYDFAYNGEQPPRLLERNFGFLGLVVASGIAQEEYIDWLVTQTGFEDIRSFDRMENTVVQAFSEVARMHGISKNDRIDLVTFTQPTGIEDPEIARTSQLYKEWIRKSGYEPVMHIADKIRFDENTGQAMISSGLSSEFKSLSCNGAYMPGHCYEYYVDMANKMRSGKDAKSTYTGQKTKMLQPFWTLLAQHKAMLPVLYKLFPDHPNLLPSVMGEDGLQDQKRIIKRVLTSAGGGAVVIDADNTTIDKRDRGIWDQGDSPNGSITQAFADGAINNVGEYAVLNLFTANGRASAVGIRESAHPIVSDEAETKTRYVPVIVR